MGNRAMIATEKMDMALYLHWNGGSDSVEAFLEYCRLRGFRSPETDDYGWARLTQIVCNFMGADGLSCGIMPYDSEWEPCDDNGDYIIRGWKIVRRRYPYESFEEQAVYGLDEMLHDIDESQPEHQQLGAFLDGVETDVEQVVAGDVAWVRKVDGTFEAMEVLGRAICAQRGRELPYIGRYGRDGDYTWNVNNFLDGASVRIVPRTREA